MRAGELRHFVQIKAPVDSNTPGVKRTYELFSNAWVSIKPFRGRERFENERVNAEVTSEVRMRYMPGIRADMRIYFSGRALRIINVWHEREIERETVCECDEVKDEF